VRYGEEKIFGLLLGALEPALESFCGGHAAKPGRTDPGRAPDIGGRCPGFNFSPPLPASPGLIGLAGGLGPACELNGLFPALGGRGNEFEVVVGDENGLFPTRGTAGGGVVGRVNGAVGGDFSIICFNSGGRSSTFTLFLAGAFLTGAFLVFGVRSAGTKSGNLSINLRTTGASTVDEALRTNSPTSCNLASSSLLSSPNSLANS
jgi:hypothetical protein